jgi:RNase P protein component
MGKSNSMFLMQTHDHSRIRVPIVVDKAVMKPAVTRARV